ncbi:MAG: hypothetical protein OXC56_00400 [Chloroflexi bacterium]|nr:hypothetical protein [Chloroflexota bacterium]
MRWLLLLIILTGCAQHQPEGDSDPPAKHDPAAGIKHCLTKEGRSLDFEDYLMWELKVELDEAVRKWTPAERQYRPSVRLDFDTYSIHRAEGRYLYSSAYVVTYAWSRDNTMTRNIRPQAWLLPANCVAIPVIKRKS